MNSLSTLARPTDPLRSSILLNRSGFTCTLLTFAPDSETLLPLSTSTDDQVLYVIEGDIALHIDGLTTIINRGGATLLRAGRTPAITARADMPAQVLRVEIPPRIVAPLLVTPGA